MGTGFCCSKMGSNSGFLYTQIPTPTPTPFPENTPRNRTSGYSGYYACFLGRHRFEFPLGDSSQSRRGFPRRSYLDPSNYWDQCLKTGHVHFQLYPLPFTIYNQNVMKSYGAISLADTEYTYDVSLPGSAPSPDTNFCLTQVSGSVNVTQLRTDGHDLITHNAQHGYRVCPATRFFPQSTPRNVDLISFFGRLR